MKKFFRWWHLISQDKATYFIGTIAVIFCNISQLYLARILGYFVDLLSHTPLPSFLQQETQIKSLWALVLLMLSLQLILAIGRVFWRMGFVRPSRYKEAKWKNDLWEKVRYFSYQDFLKHWQKGEIISRGISDTRYAAMIFGIGLVGATDILFLLIFSFILLFSLHPIIGPFILLFFLSIPLLGYKLLPNESLLYEKAQEEQDKYNQAITQLVSTIRQQKISPLKQFLSRVSSNRSLLLQRRQLKANRRYLLWYPVFSLSHILSLSFILSLGLYAVFQGSLTPGNLVAILNISFFIQTPLNHAGEVLADFRRGNVSLDRLEEVNQFPPDSGVLHSYTPKGLPPLSSSDPVFILNNVSFSYTSSGPLVLSNFNLKVFPQEKLAITGPIGSGKTTLLNLMAALICPTEGTIFFHNLNLKEFNHQWMRQFLAYVGRPFLFARTIQENLLLKQEENSSQIKEDFLWEMLRIVCLQEEVYKMPKKLKTPLGELGINLSGGQKQRLSLARALVTQPQILLLDDCLSAVDIDTEGKIVQNLSDVFKNMTVVWSAHRPSSLALCSRLITLSSSS